MECRFGIFIITAYQDVSTNRSLAPLKKQTFQLKATGVSLSCHLASTNDEPEPPSIYEFEWPK